MTGLKVVERQVIGDDRGFLSRLFCATELAEAGWHAPVSQVNHSLTRLRGTIRGLHFQRPPRAEAKLVSCLRGAVWDVAVDLRAGSPTFLHWHGEELTAANQRALLLPPGFAHGFQTLVDNCELLYLHSAAHTSELEGGINPHDPVLAINWPLPVSTMSARDRALPTLNKSFAGMIVR